MQQVQKISKKINDGDVNTLDRMAPVTPDPLFAILPPQPLIPRHKQTKLSAPEDMDTIVEEEGFNKLPISLYHGQLAGKLPALHRDPLDRMLIAQYWLIAQAQAEGLILMTADDNIGQYNLRIRDARN